MTDTPQLAVEEEHTLMLVGWSFALLLKLRYRSNTVQILIFLLPFYSICCSFVAIYTEKLSLIGRENAQI